MFVEAQSFQNKYVPKEITTCMEAFSFLLK